MRLGLATTLLFACVRTALLPAAVIVGTDALPQGFFRSAGQAPASACEKLPEIDEALERFKAGRYDECLEQLETAAQKHPNLLPARLILAKLFLMNRQIAPARAALEQAAAEDPDRPEIYLQFAALGLDEGRLTDASLHFEKALALVPEQAGTDRSRLLRIECHAGLAAVAERRGQWPTVQEQVGAWLEADPNSAPAHERLARAVLAQDRPDEAYRALQQAAKLAQSPRPPELVMAILLTQLGKADQAGPWIERADEQSADDAQAQQAIAAWYLEQGQPQKAKHYADVAATLDPEVKDLRLLRGNIARHLRQHEEAEKYFQEQYTAFPADFRASNGLALVLIEQTDPEKRLRAVQLAEVNARQYPRLAEALATLGWVYFKLGRLAEAEKALQAATAGGRSSSDTAYYLARVLAGRGRQEQVIALLQSSIDTPGTFVYREEARRWLTELKTEATVKEEP